MTLRQLAQQLQHTIDTTGQIALCDAVLGTKGLDALIQGSPIGAAAIAFATTQQIVVSDTQLSVTGTTSVLNTGSMPSTLVIAEPHDGATRLVSLIASPVNWTPSASFAVLRGTPIDQLPLSQPAFIFLSQAAPATDTSAALQAGLNLSSTISLTGVLAPAVDLLGSDVATSTPTLQGPISSTAHGITFDLRAPLGATFLLGPITLDSAFVGATLGYKHVESDGKESWAAQAAVIAGGRVPIDGLPQPVELAASLDSDDAFTLSITGGSGAIVSLGDLVALLGHDAGWQPLLPSQIQKALDSITLDEVEIDLLVHNRAISIIQILVVLGVQTHWSPPLPDASQVFTFDGMRATWTWLNPTPSGPQNFTIEIIAETTIGGHGFDLEITSDPVITGTLTDDITLSLSDLSRQFFADGVQAPDDVLQIELTALSLVADINAETFTISVGFDADFPLFGERELTITDGTATVEYDFSASQLTATVGGTLGVGSLAFQLGATLGQQTTFFGSLAPSSAPLTLTGALNSLPRVHVTLPPEIPDLALRALSVTATYPDQSLFLNGEIDATWNVPVGNPTQQNPQGLAAASVAFAVNSTVTAGTRAYSGKLTGALDLGQTFTLEYDFGQNIEKLRGAWQAASGESLDYAALGSALNIPAVVPLPPGGMPDFGFAAATIVIDFGADTLVLEATASFGTIFFIADKAKDQNQQPTGPWGFFFGIALPRGWRFSDLPGALGTDLKLLDFITFNSACLIIATRQDTFANANFPPLSTKALSVVPGLNFGANIALGGSDQTALAQMLGEFLPNEKLDVLGAIGPSLADIFVQATLDGSPIGIPHVPLQIQKPFLKIYPDPANFLLSVGGHVLFPVKDHTVDLVGFFSIEETGFEFMADAKIVGPSLDSPMGFAGVSLEEIGGEIGFEVDGGLMLGLSASFVLGGTHKSNDSFAFVFTVEGEEVNPQYLYVRFDELDFDNIFEAVVPTLELPAALEDTIVLTDFVIYWADLPTPLPNGTMSQAGFGFNGNASLFDVFDAVATLKINATQGINGGFDATPIALTVDNVALLSINGGKPAEHLHLDFNTAPASGKPYFDISAAINFLGLTEAVNVAVDKSGFSFTSHLAIENVLTMDLTAALAHRTNLSASGHATFDLSTTVGPYTPGGVTVIPQVEFDGLSCSLDASVTASTSGASLDVHVIFDWRTLHFDKQFTLTLSDIAGALKNLVTAIYTWMKNHVRTLFGELVDDVKKWAAAVKGAFTEFGQDVDNVAAALTGFFTGVLAPQAADLLGQIGFGFQDIVHALHQYWNLSVHDAAALLTGQATTCAMSTANAAMATS